MVIDVLILSAEEDGEEGTEDVDSSDGEIESVSRCHGVATGDPDNCSRPD